MFEHLLDSDPPELSDDFRDRVVANGRRRQRHVRLAAGGVVLAPLVVLGGFAVYLRGQADELERVPVVGLTPVVEPTDPTVADPTVSTPNSVADADEPEPPPIAAPTNILIAGVDQRPPGSDVTGSRADTIAVVRVDPDLSRVSLLSLPRDLWITTNDGTSRRLNSFSQDSSLVLVVSDLLDIDLNHYIEIDFAGFTSLIDIAGGVTVPFEYPVRDEQTGFTAEAGCNRLSGTDALAYVRSRRLATLDPTAQTWVIDGSADIGRIARQQDLIRRAYTAVLEQSYDVTDQLRLLNDVVDDLTVDDGLDLDGVRAIFNATAAIGAENLHTYDLTSSLSPVTIQGNSVLLADPDGLAATVDQFLAHDLNGASSVPTVTSSDTAPPPFDDC